MLLNIPRCGIPISLSRSQAGFSAGPSLQKASHLPCFLSGFSTLKSKPYFFSTGGDLFVTMELLVVTFVVATTILSVPTEAYYNLSMCVAMSICVPPLQPLDYTAILTLPPAPENNAGQKTAAAAAHLLTGSSGYRHKRSVASVPVGHSGSVVRPYYGKRAAQVYQGLLEEKDHVFGKRSVAVYPEVDESNSDNFLGRRAAPGPTGYGNRDAARYPYKSSAARYKREAAESLEVDESNADYDYDYKEGALAWPTGNRHHAGKSSLPAEKLNFAQYGKRAAPKSMEAEYSLEAE